MSYLSANYNFSHHVLAMQEHRESNSSYLEKNVILWFSFFFS